MPKNKNNDLTNVKTNTENDVKKNKTINKENKVTENVVKKENSKDTNKEAKKEENKSFFKSEKYLKFKAKVKNFMEKNSVATYSTIGITLFFLSIILTAQVKSISNTEEVLQGKREEQLANDYVNLQREYDDLKSKYEENQKVVEEYQTNAASNDSLIASMKTQISQLSILAGSTDLTGEGIIITLNDGESVKDPEERSDAIVHDSDLITVVNELKVAGAEAISVNDQRIISTSAIRCVGPVIQVNEKKVAAPFEIKAIGNAQYLQNTMKIKNDVVDMLKQYGVDISVRREDNIEIKKFDGTRELKYSIPKED